MLLVSAILVVVALQIVSGLAVETIGVGFTVIVKVWDGPEQFTLLLLNVGVTIMVAVTGDDPIFVAVKAGIFPFPEAAKPIEAAELVQA